MTHENFLKKRSEIFRKTLDMRATTHRVRTMKTKTAKSFIEEQVREYTGEMLRDALANDRDPMQVAHRIVIALKRGFISAMEEQGQRELACDLLNEADI